MMPRFRFLKPALVLCLPVFAALSTVESAKADLAAQLKTAKPGSTIDIPAGEVTIPQLTIPAGVTLAGAGVGKTILNATGSEIGLMMDGVQNVTIKNLTIKGATGVNIEVTGSDHITIESVLSVSTKTGIITKDSKAVTIQNVVAADNRIAVALSNATEVAIVNCTMGNNALTSLSAANGCSGVVFNNIFWQCPVGVVLDNAETALKIDYNLYCSPAAGRLEGLPLRRSLAAWRQISNGDAHSVQFDVQFKDAAKFDFTPTNVFDWRPFMAVTADWGIASFGGVNAPQTDLAGQSRSIDIDLGAYQSARTTGRAPDGTFTITAADGGKSAGVFTPDGINIAYLFQNLPLRAGKYPFWMPSRDWQGKSIAAGDYEVRVAESNLHNRYIGMAGNMGKTSNRLDSCSWPEEIISFDEQDRIIIAQNSFENGMGIRAFDASYQTPRWMIPGGGSAVGTAIDNGSYYLLQKSPDKTPIYNLRKLATEGGEFQAITPNVFSVAFKNLSDTAYGMTSAHGKLFVSDPGSNKIFFGDVTGPKFTEGFDMPAPSCVSYDAKGNLLWVISNNEKLLALNPDTGAVVATVTPAAAPFRMNVNNGRLAYLSRKSGKVYVLDISNPQAPTPIREIGTGDGPYGKIQPDRFWFQTDPTDLTRDVVGKWSVSLNSKGDAVIVDSCRVLFWGADGKLIKQGIGVWGQHITTGKLAGDDFNHFWNISGTYDISIDAKTQSWAPGTLWKLPKLTYPERSPVAFFNKDGRNFGLYTVNLEPAVLGLAVIEFKGPIGTALTVYSNEKGVGAVLRHDDNGDGIIDLKDPAVPILMADGKTLPAIPWMRANLWIDRTTNDFIFPGPNGLPDGLSQRIPFIGFDDKGRPNYDWAKAEITRATVPGQTVANGQFISPYDFKSPETVNCATVENGQMNTNGDFAQSFYIRSSAGGGLSNGAGTDLAGFSKDGHLRWVNPTSYIEGGEGVQTLPEKKLVLTMWSETCDYLAMNEDGLGLGSLAMSADSNWAGMWSDHPQQQVAFLGNDGKPYYVLGDYSMNCYHWFAIEGADEVKESKFAFKLSDPQVAVLAALPPPQFAVKNWFKMPSPEITITKLAAPLPIDGDPNGWKAVPPTIIVTPELAIGDIHGPKDCSAIIRLAYFGTDLYVQTIVFDDVVSFLQPYIGMYQQDGIEMSINGYMEGFKFNASHTADLGDVVDRVRFAFLGLTKVFDAATVPRSIKVLANAENVLDRKLLEGLGTDLSKSKVIVTEFKLPMTPEGVTAGDPANSMPKMQSGESFWIGFFINDNDVPGGDVQDYIAWPQSYGTFTTKEHGAKATLQ